jgi:hypothetical protein
MIRKNPPGDRPQIVESGDRVRGYKDLQNEL